MHKKAPFNYTISSATIWLYFLVTGTVSFIFTSSFLYLYLSYSLSVSAFIAVLQELCLFSLFAVPRVQSGNISDDEFLSATKCTRRRPIHAGSGIRIFKGILLRSRRYIRLIGLVLPRKHVNSRPTQRKNVTAGVSVLS